MQLHDLFFVWDLRELFPQPRRQLHLFNFWESSETRGRLEAFLEHLLSRVWGAQSDLPTNPAKFTLLPPTLPRTPATVPCSHVWGRAQMLHGNGIAIPQSLPKVLGNLFLPSISLLCFSQLLHSSGSCCFCITKMFSGGHFACFLHHWG